MACFTIVKQAVIYDAEHFFDGYLADPVYSLETLRATARSPNSMFNQPWWVTSPGQLSLSFLVVGIYSAKQKNTA